jgi:8-oxo-dGTP pyrophosphatase MutT (NUDIX family)
VRPRDAATLVLVRREAREPRILMGQRHARLAFMPGKFVFPGGRVDPHDARIPFVTPLRPEVERRLRAEARVSATRARALGLAAIRETFEETGLLVGEKREVPVRTASRSWSAFLGRGVVPMLHVLDLVARAITPPGNPRRFDTRFFLADARHVVGDAEEDLAGSGELQGLHWVPLARARDLDVPDVTAMVIDEVARRLAAVDPEHVGVPFVRYTRSGFRHGKL